MNKLELTEHHSELAGVLNSDQIGQNGVNLSLVKPILPEVARDLPNEEKTRELVNTALNIIFSKLDREYRTFWLEKFEHYNSLPKDTSKERKKSDNFVTKTAEELLQHPLNISFVQEALTNNKNNARTQDPKQQFVQRLKDKCLTLIKDKWENVEPEQLAQLVGIYASNDPSKDTAKALLTNYFKGPKSRSGRVHAYYNLVSATLDLVRDDKAFNAAVKIGFHATDILPRDPSLIGQAVLLSLPYGEEEQDFKELIIARYVLNQIGFMSSEDILSFHRENSYFVRTNEKATMAWNRKRKSVTTKIGPDVAREFNDIVMGFFDISQRPLSEDVKQSLKDTWPYSVAFDETDPLNQKFKKVFPQIAALKT